jgi:ATP-binding cassette subfamily B protein
MQNETLPNLPLRRLFTFIWKFISLQPFSFFFIFLFSLTWSIEQTLIPYLLRLVIDSLTNYETDRSAIWPAIGGLLITIMVVWTLIEFCFRARDFIRAKAFPKLEADIRMAMFDHIQHHSPRYFNEHFAGSLSNKISDMNTHVISMLHNIMMFIPAVGSSILALLFFSAINPIFSLILAVWIVVHGFIGYLFIPKCVLYSNAHAQARSDLYGKIVDSFTNNFTVNLFYRFMYEKRYVGRYQKIEQEKNSRGMKYNAWMFFFLSLVFLTGSLVINGLLILYWTEYKITTGEAVQIFNTTIQVVILLFMTNDIMPQFLQSIGIASQALGLMHDPQDVIDPPHTPQLIVRKGDIVFENVTFQYGEKKIFENKEVHIKGGEKVGLVGYSGAGKSTFVNLVLRFYPIEKGRILIDGQDINHVTLQSLRQQVSLIPQDPLLFHRSLEENIKYGNVNASNEEVIRAAKLAHCDEFIRKFPKGYDSMVGERGTKLSGGERQRIAIARAILAGSPILILDEATSALDSVTEKYIQDSLDKLMENKTTIAIAHRLSTLSKMDRILVFDKGKIIEEGSHQILLEKKGHYAHMWHMQAGGFLI